MSHSAFSCYWQPVTHRRIAGLIAFAAWSSFAHAALMAVQAFRNLIPRFLTVGRPALRSAAESAATEVMGFIHVFGDRRMPIWGGLAILSNLLLVLFCKGGPRAFYLLSVSMLILFVVIYNRFSKPINRLQTEAAKAGRKLDNARALQASWDRSLMIRFPLLAVSMLGQLVAVLATSA